VFVTNKIQVRRREQEFRRLKQAREIALENRKLRQKLLQESSLWGIVGTNAKMRAIFQRIQKVAATDANVLITGESGTGKELVARAIHQSSKRANAAFVPVDCVALPGNLLESELFGYEKGAFTGAVHPKKGLFEAAHQGTFFLDEIAELPPELQAKLLRVLQERQFRHLGGKELINVDIRVIAATNRDPLRAVKDGILREDLYYRLNVVPIHLPPLRERREDIPILIHHFLDKFCHQNGRKSMTISEEAEACLIQYHWPGNVRELQNVVERMVSLAGGSSIGMQDIPDYIREQNNYDGIGDLASYSLREAREKWLEKFEKKYLMDLLQTCQGNISQVARKAGVNRMTIYRMMKKYQISLKLEIQN
ncbi:MAG: sigma-54-dependent Fis family transcriptional regulator, partial [Calditrichaeota bacterium]